MAALIQPLEEQESPSMTELVALEVVSTRMEIQVEVSTRELVGVVPVLTQTEAPVEDLEEVLMEELEETQEVLEEVSMTTVKAMRGVVSTPPLGNQEHPSTQELVVLAITPT